MVRIFDILCLAGVCGTNFARSHLGIESAFVFIAPVAEMFFDNGYPDKLGMLNWQLLPFSRGNVTIVVRLLHTIYYALAEGICYAYGCSHLIRSRNPRRT